MPAPVEAVQERAVASGRDVKEWSHALNVWCGLGRTKDEALSAISSGMQSFYHLAYETFARWSPAGTPEEVATFLAPYLAAGCSTINLIPCGHDRDDTIAMAAQVRALLMQQS